MPVLHSYENKSGFYIRAKPHGASAPITYQVHSVAEDLFRDAGFKDNDDVPWRFLQPLIAINHIYTYGSGVEGPDSVARDLASLTEKQQEEVFDYLQSYLQIDGNSIENLADTIRGSSGQISHDLIRELEDKGSESDKGPSQSLRDIAQKHFGQEIAEESSSVETDQVSVIEFSGTGGDYSDPFSLSGGFALFDVQYHDVGRYKVRAVGETAEDHTVNVTTDQTPISHQIIDEYESDTYILNVEAPSDGNWTVKIYDEPPTEVSLPLKITGRGKDVVGPIPVEGFIKVSVSNYDTGSIRVKPARESGKSYLNDPSMKVEGVKSGKQNSEEQVMSTVDGSTDYPYLQIRADGDWIVEIEEYN